MKVTGAELQRFMDEAWPKPEDDWYWDHELFDAPDPLATYNTDDIGPIHHQGRESDDPTGGDGYNLAMLIKRWRKTRDCDAVAFGEDNMPERIWAGDFDESGFGHCVAGMHGGLYAEYIRADLASVVPSGAEPAAWMVLRKGNLHLPVLTSKEDAVRYQQYNPEETLQPLYASPQAVPAEDVAGLAERLKDGVHCSGSHPIAEDIDDADEVMAKAAAALTASEAEAADLRRKLEERERIGKMMANAIYNVHQRGLHVNADDMDSLKECQEAWDAGRTALESDNG